MPDSFVLDMPMELGLELMTPVCADCVDAKRELVDDIVNEVHRIGLVVTAVDFESSHACGVIDGRVLKATDSMPVVGLEAHNLHVCLNMMTRDFFGISVRVNSSPAHIPWQTPEPAANEGPIDTRTGGLDAMIALQVPTYSLWTKTIGSSELEDLIDGLGGQCSRMMQSDRLLGDESS